jgi:hypothetical protein
MSPSFPPAAPENLHAEGRKPEPGRVFDEAFIDHRHEDVPAFVELESGGPRPWPARWQVSGNCQVVRRRKRDRRE